MPQIGMNGAVLIGIIMCFLIWRQYNVPQRNTMRPAALHGACDNRKQQDAMIDATGA